MSKFSVGLYAEPQKGSNKGGQKYGMVSVGDGTK